MKRTVYAYKIEVNPVNTSKPFVLESFENDFMEVIRDLCTKDRNLRKHDFRQDKKILYLDNYEYNDEVSIVNLKFVSAKYDARRKVIDTDTLVDKGILKNIGDGDEEKNHVCIKFVENNCAVCLFESNYYGIGLGKIVYYLQSKIKDYHRTKRDGCYYNLNYENVVSNDFLEALAQIQRIRAVTLTVDQEDIKVSDYKALSGRADLSSEVDIMLKPVAAGIGIKKDTVKDFFKVYNDKNKRVKRVTVHGEGTEKQQIAFNTEQMKKKIIIQVDMTPDTGEVSTRSIFDTLLIEMLPL